MGDNNHHQSIDTSSAPATDKTKNEKDTGNLINFSALALNYPVMELLRPQQQQLELLQERFDIEVSKMDSVLKKIADFMNETKNYRR